MPGRWVSKPTSWAGDERGSTRWRKLKAQVLNEEPWCRACKRRPSVTADHITPLAQGGQRWDRGNLQGLCAACHKAKTSREGNTPRAQLNADARRSREKHPGLTA